MVVAGVYPEAWALMDMMTAPSTIGAVGGYAVFSDGLPFNQRWLGLFVS